MGVTVIPFLRDPRASVSFGVWRRAKNPRNGYFENVKWWETINGTLEFAHVHLLVQISDCEFGDKFFALVFNMGRGTHTNSINFWVGNPCNLPRLIGTPWRYTRLVSLGKTSMDTVHGNLQSEHRVLGISGIRFLFLLLPSPVHIKQGGAPPSYKMVYNLSN